MVLNKPILFAFCIVLLYFANCNKKATESSNISYDECIAQGGEMMDGEDCSSGKKNLGLIEDVNCICSCCK